MRIYCIFREKQDHISAKTPEVLKLTTYSDKAIILGGFQKEKKEEKLNSCAKKENDKQVLAWKRRWVLNIKENFWNV